MENLLTKIPLSELNATLERLSKLGVTADHFKQIRSSEKYSNEVARVFLNKDSARMFYGDVTDVLGEDFISPYDIVGDCYLEYTGKQFRQLNGDLPSEEAIRWLYGGEFTLIAGPPEPMSLLDIRNLDKDMFFTEEGGWFSHEEQLFSHQEKVECKWIMIQKEQLRVMGSGKKAVFTFKELETIGPKRYAPNAAEIAWCIYVYRKVNGIWLFPDYQVVSSSVDDDGKSVVVSASTGGGICLNRDARRKIEQQEGSAVRF